MTSAPRVSVARTDEDRAACFAVRRVVFVTEQQVPEEIEYDAHDATAVHLLARSADGTPLGTGRLLTGIEGPGTGSLGRLAVTRAARGLGIGAALVRAIETEAARLGLTAVDLHAQTRALGFYERLGYEAYGPEFEDAGIPHRAMRRSLV
ncbi:GNAT family N-acetyltransferase [Streptomyces bambusae]|uniref:GNAT family N-acetyltransferase n=1 Tax=Streptomyces bambusae TaxID=1550616 RepID=UPI001CFFE96A|nr:GNAT family N-acetyltransferase [Streptomyces bambusae]MCB5169637.1 GNAT family N-acetyltransferase [Streptomyces bambusae]